MKINRKTYPLILSFVVTGFLFSNLYSQKVIGGYSDFEIVESIPVETVLDNPDIRDTLDVWLEMIQNAKTSIDIEQFYVSNEKDKPLEKIIQAIIDASNRGVNVRIIADMSFYKTYPETLDKLKTEKNISVRLIDIKKFKGGVMHAKYFIVDNQQVFLGSQNFDWRSLMHIHEIGVRIANSRVLKIYSDLFELDWQLADKNDPALVQQILTSKLYTVPITINESSTESIVCTPVYSPSGLIPDENLWNETKIIDLMDSAKQSLEIQVQNYTPAQRGGYFADLDNALRRAAGRGVKVKLLVADWSKRKPTINFLKSLTLIPNIEVKMGTIPPYSGGYVSYSRVEHCKYLVVDNQRSWVGSSNWEKNYFFNTRNVGIIFDNSKLSGLLNQVFMKSWDGPYTYFVKPEVEYEAPRTGEQ